MILSKPITKVLPFVFLLLLFSCGQGLPVVSEQENWYHTYSGKAGNKEVVLHLTKAESYKGYIWLKEEQYPVMVYSDPTIIPEGDSIYLNGGNANRWISLKGIIKDGITGEITIQTNGVRDPVEKVRLSTDDSFTPLQFIYSNANAELPEQVKNDSKFGYFIGTVWPWDKDTVSEKLKLPIKDLMDAPASDTDLSKWMDSLQNNSLKNWKAAGEKLTPADAELIGMSFSKQVLNFLSVMYEDEKTITLADYVYAYEGGAHGNYSTTLENIDKKTGRVLTLEDILNPEGIKALPELLNQSARRQYQITNTNPLEDNGFFVNILKPTKNFYRTSMGIGFYYTPYEIKPYSDGEINLFVPKGVLKDYWIK